MSNGKSLLVLCSLAVVAAVAVHSASGATATNPQARVALGGACNNKTLNCTTPNSVCSANRLCICEDGYEINQNNRSACVSKLNSKCNATRPCNRPGAECVNNECRCRTDHVVSSNKTHCLPIATSLNSQCTEELQCSRLVNSRCWGGACICKDHTFQSSNTACEVKRCQSNSCDYLGYAVCVAGGTCQCNANGFQYGTRCYRSIIGKVGDKCTNDDLCHLNADGANQHVSCTKGKCTCNKPYKPNKEKTSCSGAAVTFISITTALLAVVAAMQA